MRYETQKRPRGGAGERRTTTTTVTGEARGRATEVLHRPSGVYRSTDRAGA